MEAQPIERSTSGVSSSITIYPRYGYPVRYRGDYPVRRSRGYGGHGRSSNNGVVVNPASVTPQRPAVYRAAPYYGSGRSVIRYPAIEVYPNIIYRY
ncbi:hypothetical protein [Pantanalinema sp. GBBB05]|uniref:hypothetical protein n=1 Tax=Pantanalinema sp. GBBB05 TaxID=2604139 RepID=UPI001D413D53|nr:hypothetical protein [Pantanalinema sp. GBBB05]